VGADAHEDEPVRGVRGGQVNTTITVSRNGLHLILHLMS
jgi:hypothetical protein